MGFSGSPISVTSIGVSVANPGQENASYRGKFTTAEGIELDFYAHKQMESENPTAFYSAKKNVDGTFLLEGKQIPPLEHIGFSIKNKDGIKGKSEAYQLSLWDKNDRRYVVKATVEYVQDEVGNWKATNGSFSLTLTRHNPKQNQVLMELAGPGIADSIIKLPKIEK